MAILTDYCALTRRPRSALSAALAALVVAVGALFLSPLGYAHAQVAPTVTDGGVTNEFPDGMTFSVSAESDSEIERVRLRYEIQPDGTSAIGEADFEPGTSVNGTFVLEGNNPPKIYLPPGTVIDYYWEVTDADGDTAVTAPQTFFYDDSRFSWSKVEGDGVTIYYYSGSDSDAQAMHGVAKESLAEMSALLGTEIPFGVQVWTYQDTNDMKPALSRRSETYESQVTTAGVRVASDTVLVLGNVSFDTLRHELTHVVTAEAGESAFGTLPAWLDEGTAVYGQNDPGGFRDAVERAIARGNVLSVKEISAYPGDPNKVGLFYGQGWALVSYLVDTYGEEQFAQLFAEVKDGKRIDRALDAVYGFDQDGLEDQWREANDLPPRVTAAPDAQETDAPSQASAGDDDGGTSPALIIALIVGLLALAGAIGFAGITLARRL
jgi:hypothetical protein